MKYQLREVVLKICSADYIEYLWGIAITALGKLFQPDFSGCDGSKMHMCITI